MIIEVPYFKYLTHYKLWKFKNKKIVEKYKIDFKVYDGIPNSPWNGGRTPENIMPVKGISVSFSLTNVNIDNYYDEVSHQILKEYNIVGNSIIISDLKLCAMLQDMYSNYTFIYSITAMKLNTLDKDGVQDMLTRYTKIEPLVDYIVPRVEIMEHPDLLHIINMKQYLILYSYECVYCPFYNEHYNFVNANQEMKGCWFKTPKLFDETPFNKDDYDYQYNDSRIFFSNMDYFKYNKVAGFKIGRNEQSWEKMTNEINDIILKIERDEREEYNEYDK